MGELLLHHHAFGRVAQGSAEFDDVPAFGHFSHGASVCPTLLAIGTDETVDEVERGPPVDCFVPRLGETGSVVWVHHCHEQFAARLPRGVETEDVEKLPGPRHLAAREIKFKAAELGDLLRLSHLALARLQCALCTTTLTGVVRD